MLSRFAVLHNACLKQCSCPHAATSTQEQAPLLRQGQVTWDVCAVPVLDQLRADLRRVRNIAEEVRVLFHAGNAERASLHVQECTQGA
jgi:hypothetical protein